MNSLEGIRVDVSNGVHRHVSDIRELALQQRHGELVECARRRAATRGLAVAALATEAVGRGAGKHGKTRQSVAATRLSAQCADKTCGMEGAHDLM